MVEQGFCKAQVVSSNLTRSTKNVCATRNPATPGNVALAVSNRRGIVQRNRVRLRHPDKRVCVNDGELSLAVNQVP